MKYLISFSGGLGSFWSAKKMVDQYGKNNVIALFIDVGWEDDDLYRFIHQTINVLDIKLIYVKAPYTPPELMKKENVIYNNRMANCTSILKMRLFKSILLNKDFKCLGEVFKLNTLIVKGIEFLGTLTSINYNLVMGIDYTEAHRCQPIEKNYSKYGYTVLFPLVDDKNYHRKHIYDYLTKNCIEIPKMYKLGFSHNNCGGRCVKAGQGHFKKLLEKLPDRFNELLELEKSINNGKNTFLKKTKNNITSSYSMEALKQDIKNRPKQIDLFDIGGCGCFLE
jgi:hypothetical protein